MLLMQSCEGQRLPARDLLGVSACLLHELASHSEDAKRIGVTSPRSQNLWVVEAAQNQGNLYPGLSAPPGPWPGSGTALSGIGSPFINFPNEFQKR